MNDNFYSNLARVVKTNPTIYLLTLKWLLLLLILKISKAIIGYRYISDVITAKLWNLSNQYILLSFYKLVFKIQNTLKSI